MGPRPPNPGGGSGAPSSWLVFDAAAFLAFVPELLLSFQPLDHPLGGSVARLSSDSISNCRGSSLKRSVKSGTDKRVTGTSFSVEYLLSREGGEIIETDVDEKRIACE